MGTDCSNCGKTLNELNGKVWKLEQKIEDSHIDVFNKIFNAPEQLYASSPKREKGKKKAN